MQLSVVIQAGGYEATVTPLGGGLQRLAFGGRELVTTFPQSSPAPSYMGSVLAPWPNRIVPASYLFGGKTHELAINDPTTTSAMHGLVSDLHWTVHEQTKSSVELHLALSAQPGYPWNLEVVARYAVSEQGLVWSVTATNRSPEPAPYGCGIHPYLRAPDTMESWTLTMPSIAAHPTFGSAQRRPLGDTKIDHTFVDSPHPSGERIATITDIDGRGSGISWSSGTPWVQVYTADQVRQPHTRSGVAIEPMTCPPNAFRTGEGLVVLDPGAHHQASWRIFAVN